MIHRESARVAKLSLKVSELLGLEQESRLKAVELEIQAKQVAFVLTKHNHTRTEVC